jgi:hypothetical protein
MPRSELHCYKLCVSTTNNMRARQERVKGMNWWARIPQCQAYQASEHNVDHTSQEESTDVVGVVGREAPRFERSDRPTTPRGKETLPDKTYFS